MRQRVQNVRVGVPEELDQRGVERVPEWGLRVQVPEALERPLAQILGLEVLPEEVPVEAELRSDRYAPGDVEARDHRVEQRGGQRKTSGAVDGLDPEARRQNPLVPG